MVAKKLYKDTAITNIITGWEIFFFTLFIFFAACSPLAPKGLSSLVHSNYKRGDYEGVIRLTSDALDSKKLPSEIKAEILFLRALALEKLDRFGEAQAVFEVILVNFNGTTYGYKAKKKLKRL